VPFGVVRQQNRAPEPAMKRPSLLFICFCLFVVELFAVLLLKPSCFYKSCLLGARSLSIAEAYTIIGEVWL